MPEDSVGRLKQACDAAYDNFPKYCNQSTLSVLRELVDPKWPLELAGDMIDRIMAAGWPEVGDDEAWQAAGRGKVVVVGLKAGDDAHVLVVYPGPRKRMGGFDCQGHHYPPVGAPLPLAMSTSVSPWCGTRSKGDKTIADAWKASDWPQARRWCQP